MKAMKRMLCLLLTALLLLSGAALAQAATIAQMQQAADAAESEPQFPFLAETDELAVNVRAEMSTKAKRVGRLERGTQLTVLSADVNAAGEVWYAVELKDGTQGYIRSDLLVRSEEQEIAPAAAQTAAKEESAKQAAAQTAFKVQTNQSAVNIRSEATAESARVVKVSRGEVLTVLGQVVNSAKEVWYAVQLEDGTQGYIRSDLVAEYDETAVKQASYQSSQKKASSQEKTAVKSSSGRYIGNKNTKKFHRSSCHTLPKEKNRVYFSSRDKAVSSGYSACKNCDP